MTDYLVEAYAAEPEPASLAGLPGYVCTVHVPSDQTAFHLFERVSLEEVRAALERACVTYDRIVEARYGLFDKEGT